MEDIYLKAADAVIANIRDRKGIGDEFDQIDSGIQNEIRETFAEIIRDNISGD